MAIGSSKAAYYTWQRRKILAAASAAGLCAAAPAALAQSANWKPAGPVKIVVPWPPGGASDILARYIGQHAAEKLGQPIVVENRPGASGSIGSQLVYQAPADGTTLLLGITDSNSIYPHTASPRYDSTKFVPVAPLAQSAFVLLGRPDLPANNLQEFLALLKKDKLSYASAGVGGTPHMMTVAFSRAAKVDNLLHIPYAGMAPALQALLANQVDFMLVSVGGATQYRSRLKFYGVTSAQRVPAIGDVPTLTEQGVPMVGGFWMGVLAPPNTPAAAVGALFKAIEEVTSSPQYQAKVVEFGMAPLPGTQSEFNKYYLDEYRKWGELVKAANVKIE